MPRFPVVSGHDVIRALRRFGYEPIRQHGSHVRLACPSVPTRNPVDVPLHRTVKRGTLKSILRTANVTVEELREAL